MTGDFRFGGARHSTNDKQCVERRVKAGGM